MGGRAGATDAPTSEDGYVANSDGGYYSETNVSGVGKRSGCTTRRSFSWAFSAVKQYGNINGEEQEGEGARVCGQEV
jgi:hypothetical protein